MLAHGLEDVGAVVERTGQLDGRFDQVADTVVNIAAIGADGTELEDVEELADVDPTTAS